MNRRSFLRGAGVVGAAAITERVFPFRTFFFPPERKYQNVFTGERTIKVDGIAGVVHGDILVEGQWKGRVLGPGGWATIIDIYSTDMSLYRGSYILNERTGVYEPLYTGPGPQMSLFKYTPHSPGEGFLNLVRSTQKEPSRYVTCAKLYKGFTTETGDR